MRVALYTLGCKVNQYETQKIAEDFRSHGFEIVKFSEHADVYVINTCTVTQTADSKSRQAARAAVKRNPEAAVIITGCYADTSPEQLKKIEGVNLVIGNEGKENLAELVLKSLAVDVKIRNPQSAIRNVRTRALLKIQDGCDQYCSYCAVPLARPVMSNRPQAEVIYEAKELADNGYKEIVLTGIRLGRYENGLSDLLAELADIQGIERIRLSSIELTDIPDDLIALMSENKKICRHLHIPLQSGDNDVLARMNRPYTAEEFASFVEEARLQVPGIAITTDIMIGFPGETEEQFENTFKFADCVKFARTHVFRFSSRPGTAAALFKNTVMECEKARRSRLLMEQAAKHQHEFACGLIGKNMPVLVESKCSGLTDNYVRVILDGAAGAGEIVDVRIENVTRGTASGKVIE